MHSNAEIRSSSTLILSQIDLLTASPHSWSEFNPIPLSHVRLPSFSAADHNSRYAVLLSYFFDMRLNCKENCVMANLVLELKEHSNRSTRMSYWSIDTLHT